MMAKKCGCHYFGCGNMYVPEENDQFMCPVHWAALPHEVRMKAFKALLIERSPRRDASWAPWLRAGADAVEAVAKRVDPSNRWILDRCALERRFALLLEFAHPLGLS